MLSLLFVIGLLLSMLYDGVVRAISHIRDMVRLWEIEWHLEKRRTRR
jgi:hypothetical protein